MATISSAIDKPASGTGPRNGKTYRGPFAIMTTLFFLWGFMTVFNDILIPQFKDAFTLDYFHAMLVQLAFFGAYFIGALTYFVISATTGDPIAKIGYKNAIVLGLLISAAGSALFWPAANLAPRFEMIVPGDLHNMPSLVGKLKSPKDPVSVYVSEHLSNSTRQLLGQNSTANEDLKMALAADLNKIVHEPMIYDQQRFSDVKFSPATDELLKSVQSASSPDQNAIIRLNRALLEDAYSGDIAKNLLPYWVFLSGLFVVGLGFAMLQIPANPYVTILGPERTASSRLNLAQGFNSIGTTVGPIIGGYLIFQYFAKAGVSGAEAVKVPYLMFCIVFLVLAAIFFFIHLPHVGEAKIERGAGALRYPHVVLGVIGIFMYVGGEVSIGSSIISFLKLPTVANLPEVEASKFVAIYWGGLMIGRFMGAVGLSEMKKAKKQIALIVIPLLAYMLLWFAKSAPLDALKGGSSAPVFTMWKDQFVQNWSVFKIYLPFVGLCWLLFHLGKSLADRTLAIFSCTVVALLLTAILVGGRTAMWCVVSAGLFSSIGWSNTFSLALEGTGIYKSQVSSLLVMAILGGAILPVILGKIADLSSLRWAFIVPMIAYAYVAFYGLIGHKVGRGRKVALV